MSLQELGKGVLSRMKGIPGQPVDYYFRLDNLEIPLNSLIGVFVRLCYQGAIFCCHCGTRTNKSFAQGFCYPCFKSLAQCDRCIMSPEHCHYEQGTCREPEWGRKFCMQDHIVYLANSSGLKVGITRVANVPTRWIDQGASQALPILRMATRRYSGLVEDFLRAEISDRTNWRTLLRQDMPPIDLVSVRERIFEDKELPLTKMRNTLGTDSMQPLQSGVVEEFSYPVRQYPQRITSLDFEKTPVIEGMLMGIKGQYLILDIGVLNIRKYTSYHLSISA